MDGAPQFIKDSVKKEQTSSESSEFNILAESPRDYFDIYENLVNVASYEASYTYNGTSYRFCTVYLSEKPNSIKYLSTVFDATYLVKGGMTNINQVNQYLLTAFKFAAKKANSYNPSVIGKVDINTLIAAIPGVEPQYLYHGSNVHLIGSGSIDEYIRYVYVYDTAKSDWRLCGSGNYIKMSLSHTIYYKPGTSIQSKQYTTNQYLYGNYNQLYMDAVAWFDYQKTNGVTYDPLDGVLKEAEIQYENGSTTHSIKTIPLCADRYPAFISFFY